MKEKQAIITLNYVKNNDELYILLRQICVTSIRDYARRMNVDFVLMNNNNDRYDGTFNQLQCLDYLDYYEKILYLDGDCYVPKSFNIDILYRNYANLIGTQKKNKEDWLYIERDDCYLVYSFVIFCINRDMRHYFLTRRENRIDLCEEIYINKVIKNNCLDKFTYNLPYILDSKFFPKKIKNNKIYHFICNNMKTKFYRDILIKEMKEMLRRQKRV